MAAGNTYEAIFTDTLASAQASVTFSSIPSTYTDLVLVISGKYASNDDSSPSIRFNNDTSSNYSETRLDGNGTSATSGRQINQTAILVASMSGTESISIVNIMNYANTTTYKTTISRGNTSAYRTRAYAGLWRSTAAINRIDILNNGTYNFAAGSTFSLYGIKAA